MEVKEHSIAAEVSPQSFGFPLIPDEDGSEFEKELVEALEGLSVTSAAEKLSKVAGHTCCKHQCIYFKADVSMQ